MINRGGRAFSSPEIASSSHSEGPINRDANFEGVAANVKLLLKLIHEQSHANNGDHDDRRTQRVAGMITILDDVKSRIQRFSPPVGNSLKELRRCNTDLRPHRAPRDKKSADVLIDEKEKLRRELHSCNSARKSLEAMCCSLGKEKEIMASELSRKVHELNEMEELINDLKAQNETLLGRLRDCAAEHSDNKHGGEIHEGGINAFLQERNKALSEQLLKSLDGYRSLKRKYKDAKHENIGFQTTMEEMGIEVAQGLERIQRLKQQLTENEVQKSDIETEMSELEVLLQSFNMKISKHMQEKSTRN